MTSETDTELIIHLLHQKIGSKRSPKLVLDAFKSVIDLLEGAWAIAVIVSGIDGMFVARDGAPLVLGRSENCVCVSSDPLPLYGTCTEVAYLDDGDVALLTRKDIVLISESCFSFLLLGKQFFLFAQFLRI